jgi:hypothetical protein
MIDIAASYDKKVYDDSLSLTHILTKGQVWIEMEKVTKKS